MGGNVDGVAGNIVDGVANPRLPHLTKHVQPQMPLSGLIRRLT